MLIDFNGHAVDLRPATVDRAADVLDLLDEAGSWLHEQGITDQWPRHFEPSWIEKSIERGETWLASVADELVGTITLNWSDQLWRDLGDVDRAGYVHRMTVRRWARGLGAALLGWAAQETRRQGRDRLRLDCVTVNQRLNAYYRAAGFSHRGDIPIGGAPGMRELSGERLTLSRYELSLSGTTSDGVCGAARSA